jgi:pantothenate kinase-related protein Tda10
MYDKSQFNGQGDRAPEERWEWVNRTGEEGIEVVVFEGWSLGFRRLGDEVEKKWREAKERREIGKEGGELWKHRLEDLVWVDDALRGYDLFTE